MAARRSRDRLSAFRYQKGNFSSTAITLIASATKMLTGVTILRLVEAGRTSLSDNPQKYLSYWTSGPADPRSRVTLQQLLSFTSGFNAGEDDRDTCIFDGGTTIAACARSYYEAGLQSTPGSAFSHGPAHLQIAGAMAEAATGLPVLYAPDAVITSGQWHCALASWRKCDTPTFTSQCATQRLVSSPGAFGWTPWIDYDRGYWAVIGMPDEASNGVALEQQLQPLINTYRGQP
jgi:CubicO group peptidase (beta-lactamase class C family)